MKHALPIIGALLLLALGVYLVLYNTKAEDEISQSDIDAMRKTSAPNKHLPPSGKTLPHGTVRSAPKESSKSTPSKTLPKKTQVERHNVEEVPVIEEGPVPGPEEVSQPEEPTPVTPKVSPQRKSAGHFLRALSQPVSASEFCATPFSLDGKSVDNELDKIQEILDDAGEKAIQAGLTFEVVEFASIDATQVEKSNSTTLKEAMKNKSYAALRDHAIAQGGHVGVMRINTIIGDKVEESSEWIIMAFNKEGKLIGFKD